MTLLSYVSSYAKVTKPKARESGVAVLSIKMEDGYSASDITHDDLFRITYTLEYDDVVLENKGATISGRGNYTWYQPKKPYAIKCDEKENWFGFGKAKDWVLLANITDQTSLRNYYAFTLASMFNFSYTPQVRHVHLFIDGVYKGLYLATEKVEIDSRRVDVDIKDYDCLLEIDNNYGGGEPNHFTSEFGNLYVVKDPSNQNLKDLKTEEGLSLSAKRYVLNAKTKVNNFEQAVVNRLPLDEISKYMDISSLVDWYIFNEIMKNDDTLFNSSIYMYNDNDGVLHMGPVWDYDLAMGGIDRFDGNNVNPTGFMFENDYWGRPNWFKYLLDRDDFNELVSKRWKELISSDVFNKSLEDFDKTATMLTSSYELNYSVWKNSGVFVVSPTYESSVAVLRNFITKRIKWLDSQWNMEGITPIPDTPIPTETPVPTPEPTCAPTDVPTQEPSEKTTENGCGGFIASGVVIIVLLTTLMVLFKRKVIYK